MPRRSPARTSPTRLWSDRRGVSAVEFALIAPVMITLYFGLGVLCEAMMAQRRVSHATSAVGDLVTQASTIHDSDATDIFSSSATIMAPFSPAALQLRMTSITADASMRAKVDWSQDNGGSTLKAYAAGQVLTSLPAGLLMAAGDSIVMTDSLYPYTPPAPYFLPNGVTFHDTFYLRPRQTAQVTRVSP